MRSAGLRPSASRRYLSRPTATTTLVGGHRAFCVGRPIPVVQTRLSQTRGVTKSWSPRSAGLDAYLTRSMRCTGHYLTAASLQAHLPAVHVLVRPRRPIDAVAHSVGVLVHEQERHRGALHDLRHTPVQHLYALGRVE